ncbi:uncharacterized protein BJX67DRAFT_366471 [Aspergillus lucknowensis]|uniref:Pyridoxamine 5'-phosphate oxidase Alr4036 family FMN-binding domain-containing protein n=1 Tax=Aspergillus lucknowensis TaxID=176173 RepID=A0ABR4LCP9_9EURO
MPPPAVAPWRSLFLTSLEKSKASSFSLTTVAYNAQHKPVPRSRTVEFRGFWPKPASALHPSGSEALKAQNIGLKPEVYDSDMLSITTDARMKKTGELAESDGVVEGLFWFEPVSVQWRIRGRAIVIGGPAMEKAEWEARERIRKGMRLREGVDGNGEDVKSWDWDRQVTTYFAAHTPVMRGSFKNPPPGVPRSETPSTPELKLNQKVEDLNDPIARENFRVLVICPEEVEILDLSSPDDVRRTNWVFEDGGKWEEIDLWP